MLTEFNRTFSLLAVLALFNFAASASMGQERQDSAQRVQPLSSPTVTAASSGEAVRFSASGNITRIRLEVFSVVGERVFDSGNRDGNVFDWRWQDEKASAFSAESYLCVVTVESLSGKTSRKLANVSFAAKQATLKPIEVTQLNPVQAQALGVTETDTPLTIIRGEQAIAATVIAHDGNDGQISRTRGAFSFRLGDFFSGNDQEQMRLTEDGNLGIGTAQPKAKLDVAGTIRAQRVLIAKPTFTANDKSATNATLTGSDESGQPLASGVGTENRLAKWTDNAGTLSDSIVLDTGTGLQLTAAPSNQVETNLIYLNSPTGTMGVLASSVPSFGAINGPYFALRGNQFTTFPNQRGNFAISAGKVSNPAALEGGIKFLTGNDQLSMFINNAGNVGIGTPQPGYRLDVVGRSRFRQNEGDTGTTNTAGFWFFQNTPMADRAFIGMESDNSVGFYGNNGGGWGLVMNTQTGNVNAMGKVNLGFSYPTNGARFNIASGDGAGFVGGPSISLENVQGGFRHWITTQNGGDDAINFYLNDSNSQSGSTAPGTGSIPVLTLYNFRTIGIPTGISFPRLGIGEISPLATLDIRGGAGAGGANNPNAVSFQWREGGFRHWISTRHNGTLGSNNAIDFYVNNSTTAGGSTGPGVGSIHVMTLESGNVGIGTTTPNDKLEVNGILRVDSLGSAGGTQLCRNLSNQIANCSSSLRYKTNIAPFSSGLSFIKQLRPIMFDWKQGGRRDVGFGAEDVAKIDPLFVTYNDKGEVEGVKYDRLNAAFVNAFKEQQAQIERQQKQINELKQMLMAQQTVKAKAKRLARRRRY
jgi:hypothetical protein